MKNRVFHSGYAKIVLKGLLLLVGFLGVRFHGYANMASPITHGTLASTVFGSKDIDILQEQISVRIAPGYGTAFWDIAYHIRTDRAGRQIPLLFHAKDYQGDFLVRIDGEPAALMDIPESYRRIAGSPFEQFSNAFSHNPYSDDDRVDIQWSKNEGNTYPLSELKYFEADLSQGDHVIRVSYQARPWQDRSHWVNHYSFRYALSPAKHWRSFGSLAVTLYGISVYPARLTTNLGPLASGDLKGVAKWEFSQLPSDYIELEIVPQIDEFARALIAIGPNGIAWIFAFLLFAVHVWAIRKHRRRRLEQRFSWVVILGSFAIPMLALITYMLAFGWIDAAIGAEAARFHGYTFLALLLYPFFVPIYWLVMWLVDRWVRSRLRLQAQNFPR